MKHHRGRPSKHESEKNEREKLLQRREIRLKIYGLLLDMVSYAGAEEMTVNQVTDTADDIMHIVDTIL